MKAITTSEPAATPRQPVSLDLVGLAGSDDELLEVDVRDRGDTGTGGRSGERPPAPELGWDPDSDVMTTDEACRFLKVSRPTLVEIIKRGEIPCRRVGRAWRFHRGSVIEWLEGNSRVSRSPRKRR